MKRAKELPRLKRDTLRVEEQKSQKKEKSRCSENDEIAKGKRLVITRTNWACSTETSRHIYR